jgi:hypothetical protein
MLVTPQSTKRERKRDGWFDDGGDDEKNTMFTSVPWVMNDDSVGISLMEWLISRWSFVAALIVCKQQIAESSPVTMLQRSFLHHIFSQTNNEQK